MDPLLLARAQFAANMSFHILFPTINIALGWILLFMRLRWLKTADDAWLAAYRFWTKVFALSFALGVVSGVTMSFQFGTNWPGYMQRVGDIAGPLLGYEVLTAFFLESSFLGIMLFGHGRVSERVHLVSIFLVAFGTTVSAFWILCLGSWMQTPVGYEIVDGVFRVTSWPAILWNPSFPYRLAHMLIASALTVSFMLAGVSAWQVLHGAGNPSTSKAMRLGLTLAAILVPAQVAVGDAHGLNTLEHQPQKIAAIEAIWDTQRGAPLLLFAWPDEGERRNDFAIGIPRGASLILRHDAEARIQGLNDFPGATPARQAGVLRLSRHGGHGPVDAVHGLARMVGMPAPRLAPRGAAAPAAPAAGRDDLLRLARDARGLVRRRDRAPALHRPRPRAHVRGRVHRAAREDRHDLRAVPAHVRLPDRGLRRGRALHGRQAGARGGGEAAHRRGGGRQGPGHVRNKGGATMTFDAMLPVIFMGIMGLAMLAYVALDGYDLGVGMLMPTASDEERDTMIASIGPFWDANETWLVLGVGILLIAFPKAHGLVLTALYMPVAFMLIGLTLRGVAFDFRVKARDDHRAMWNRAFILGSGIASAAQGWMLGRYVTGLQEGWQFDVFAGLIALALCGSYVLLGACWLILKTEGALQARAIGWAKRAWPFVVAGMGLISIITPWVSPTVRERWFALPAFFALLPIPLATAIALVALRALLNSPRIEGRQCWVPFVLVVDRVRARLPRARVQPLPVRRDGPAHALAGREQPGGAEGDPRRRRRRRARDRGLHRAFLPRVRRQGDAPRLRLSRVARSVRTRAEARNMRAHDRLRSAAHRDFPHQAAPPVDGRRARFPGVPHRPRGRPLPGLDADVGRAGARLPRADAAGAAVRAGGMGADRHRAARP
jgi:cytochrome bd-type quinol oxidase subunit 1